MRYKLIMVARRSQAHRPVLEALARGALGPAYTSEVGRHMADTIAVLTESDRVRLTRVLRMLGTRAGALALTGRGVPVSWLTPAEAETVLRRWVGSRSPSSRALATAVTSLALQCLYGNPGPEWKRIGYPGPLGGPPDGPRRIQPHAVAPNEILDCDVVIVGSGAGGGCVAAGLAAAGVDVIVLEKGGYHSESDFHHFEARATNEMYLYGATLASKDGSVRILSGSTLGGGTVVNYATSFRTPDHVLEQWREVSGIDAFTNGEIEQSLDEVAGYLGVNTDSSAAGRRDELIEEGLKKLGWHVDMLPRAVEGCTQDEGCGYCGFGCRTGAKQSTMRRYLQDAFDSGARIVVGADVRRVTIAGGRAEGVQGLVDGRPFEVRARAVVAAAGAIETPALLLRSGLRGQVGHNLHLHPGSASWGIFDHDVNMWEGTTQARYSNELRARDDGWGPIFETVPVHPGWWSAALHWRCAQEHLELMGDYRKIGFCAVLPRDRSSGRVRIGRDGGPRVTYRLGAGDEGRVTEGIIAAARVLEAAGAKRIFSPHPGLVSYEPGRAGAHEEWAAETRRLGYRNSRVTFLSYHQMGSCRMGLDPRTSAIGADNESHEVSNLFVTDGSAFPTASGVNPMLSIYGIAHRAAKKIAARLT